MPEPRAADRPTPAPPAHWQWDEVWDGGDRACGDLVLELAVRLRRETPGRSLLVIAHDPGAPQDIPAWCRMTRHSLLGAAPPHFWIRRRAEWET